MIRKVCLLICILLLVGCSPDSRELDQRSVIMGMGIDEGKNNRFEISIQLPILTEGNSGSTAPQGREFEIFQTEANTLWDGLSDLEAITPSVLFLGHLKAVLISEKVAENDLPYVLDLLERESTIGSQIYLIVVEGSAKEFIEKESPLVNLPSLYLERFFRADQKLSRSQGMMLFEYRRESNMISNSSVIPLAKVKDGNIKIEGMGVFKDHKMVGKLDPQNVGISQLLKNNKLNFMNYTINIEDDLKASLSRIELTQEVEISRTNPVHFAIDVKGKGELIAVDDINKKVNIDLIEKMDKQMNKELKKQIEQTIKSMQTVNADPWLLGHRVWALSPDYFETLNWNDGGWQDATFDLNVDFEVLNTGQRGFINKEKRGN